MNFSLCNHTKYVELLRLFGNVFFLISPNSQRLEDFLKHTKKNINSIAASISLFCVVLCLHSLHSHFFRARRLARSEAIQREKYFSYIFI